MGDTSKKDIILMKRKKTFEMEYNYFEVDDKVQPASEHCPLMKGIYTVVHCIEPETMDDECTVFVHGHTTGVNADHTEEISDHQKAFLSPTA